jgi:hypothetical protein
MLMEPTLEKLYDMKLNGMAQAFKEQIHHPAVNELSFDERFSLLVDQQWTWQEERKMKRLLQNARLKINACIEDIDFKAPRGIDKSVILRLANCDWCQKRPEHHHHRPHRRGQNLSRLRLRKQGMQNGLLRPLHPPLSPLPGSWHCQGRWLLPKHHEKTHEGQGPHHRRSRAHSHELTRKTRSLGGRGGQARNLFHSGRHSVARRPLAR